MENYFKLFRILKRNKASTMMDHFIISLTHDKLESLYYYQQQSKTNV